jgi:hypothetical protein
MPCIFISPRRIRSVDFWSSTLGYCSISCHRRVGHQQALSLGLFNPLDVSAQPLSAKAGVNDDRWIYWTVSLLTSSEGPFSWAHTRMYIATQLQDNACKSALLYQAGPRHRQHRFLRFRISLFVFCSHHMRSAALASCWSRRSTLPS